MRQNDIGWDGKPSFFRGLGSSKSKGLSVIA